MQGLNVLATIVDEITRVDGKFVKSLQCKIQVKVTWSRCVLS